MLKVMKRVTHKWTLYSMYHVSFPLLETYSATCSCSRLDSACATYRSERRSVVGKSVGTMMDQGDESVIPSFKCCSKTTDLVLVGQLEFWPAEALLPCGCVLRHVPQFGELAAQISSLAPVLVSLPLPLDLHGSLGAVYKQIPTS